MGSDEQFAEFATQRWSLLVNSAVLLGAEHHEAEDLAQTVLLRCYLAWPKVQAAADPAAYVMRILLNAFRSSRRRRWWHERPSAELPEDASRDETEGVEISDAIRRALGGLSDTQREVLVLRFYGHLSEQQTADALKVPVGTVKSRTSRALQRLAVAPDVQELRNRNVT